MQKENLISSESNPDNRSFDCTEGVNINLLDNEGLRAYLARDLSNSVGSEGAEPSSSKRDF